MRTRTGARPPPPSRSSNTTAPGSASPKGLTPLNMSLARPSQKLRWLNTALITVGVLRASTRRVLMPWTMKPAGSGAGETRSRAWPVRASTNLAWAMPWDEATSLVSRTTGAGKKSGSALTWKGNWPALRVAFGPPPSEKTRSGWGVASCLVLRSPGLRWFLTLGSAPALK